MRTLYTLFLVILVTVSLSGCGCFKAKTVDQIIYVDRPIKCKKAQINVPDSYPLDKVTKSMSMEDKTKLIISELEVYIGYTKELEVALGACTE